jgi:acetyltransferase-like isoleucine patch superfamily enzyme
MFYQFFLFISQLYTWVIKHQFYSFGKKSIIKPFANLSNCKYISIGHHVNIGSSCRITVSNSFGKLLCHSPNIIKIKIGNHVDIGNGTFISANNDIQIGNHVIMAPYVFITDHDHGIFDVTKNLHQQPITEGGSVIIKDNVFLGTKSSILKNVTIGQHSTIGANSVVVKDIPPFCIAAGNPAKIIKKYDFKQNKWLKV